MQNYDLALETIKSVSYVSFDRRAGEGRGSLDFEVLRYIKIFIAMT